MPDIVGGKSGKRDTAAFLAVMVSDAPGAFEVRGGSLDRLAESWGVSRRRALELVLLGLVRQTRELQRRSTMRESFDARRAA